MNFNPENTLSMAQCRVYAKQIGISTMTVYNQINRKGLSLDELKQRFAAKKQHKKKPLHVIRIRDHKFYESWEI